MLAAMRAVICAVLSLVVPGLGDGFVRRYRTMALWVAIANGAALVSVLSIKDFFGSADFIAKRDGRPHEMYITVALVYLIACFTLSRGATALHRRIAIVR